MLCGCRIKSDIHLFLDFRRRATRISSGSWSRTERRRAANSDCPPSPAATACQPTGNERRRTVTRTSSGCDVTLSSPQPSSLNSSSLSECLRQSSSHETPTVVPLFWDFFSLAFFFFADCTFTCPTRTPGVSYLLIADYLRCSAGTFHLLLPDLSNTDGAAVSLELLGHTTS